jgi:hypothetical protein
MQALLDTLQIDAQPVQFSYFLENKNGKLTTCKGGILGQITTTKGSPFNFCSSIYVDDSFFIFSNRHKLHNALINLNKHFACFCLTMYVGTLTLAIDQVEKLPLLNETPK